MNKKFIDKLKDTGSFILCLGVLLGIAYFSGFLKGFAPSDFLDAYQRVVYNLSKNSKSAEDRAGILSTGNSTAKKSSSFSSYRPHTIPETVIRGVHSSGTWTNIFESDKKVVFYLYDPTGEDSSLSEEFHHKMTSYINITVTILHKMIHSASINNSMYARCRIIVNFFCINKKK